MTRVVQCPSQIFSMQRIERIAIDRALEVSYGIAYASSGDIQVPQTLLPQRVVRIECDDLRESIM